MNRTKIEWVKNPDGTQGYTWNPITGCLNGCDYCYARELANTRLKDIYLANTNIALRDSKPITSLSDIHSNLNNLQQEIDGILTDPFYPRFWEDRIRELEDRHTHNNRFPKPMGCFVCDMSDLFGIGIPEEWTRRVLDVISKQMTYPALNDRFYLLTKQPQNLIKFSLFPDNCFVGVTATGYKMFVDALSYLLSVKARIKYISFEPLLSWDKVITNNFAYSNELRHSFGVDQLLREAGISWVILGSQTKPYKPPKIEWVREIVEACDKAGIPVFLKDNLKPLFGKMNSTQQTEYQDILIDHFFAKDSDSIVKIALRQEMPEGG